MWQTAQSVSRIAPRLIWGLRGFVGAAHDREEGMLGKVIEGMD
jgi:hypothetical protein